MPLPIAIAVAYLAANFALMLWLERGRAQGHEPTRRLVAVSRVLRYGPPLLGAAYLELIAGDWLFVLFVAAFFGAGFWLLDGLLAYTDPRPGSEPMRNAGGEDRPAGAPPRTDRD